MKFVSLTHAVLLDLQLRGYNILTSKNTVDDENPTWYPITVPDVWEYLLQLDCKGSIVPLQEPAILVIADALKDIAEEELQGEVFLETDYLQGLQYRAHVYDKRYQFISNPENYDFDFDPQRVLLRNYGLHSGDHALYIAYLGLHYPEYIIDEIQDMEDLTRSLICLDRKQAKEWFSARDITMIQSDIWIHDKDAIITIFAIKNHQKFMTSSEDNEDLIYNLMSTANLLSLRDLFWVDPRIN